MKIVCIYKIYGKNEERNDVTDLSKFENLFILSCHYK
jgi:hypothetical protein